MKRKLFLLLSLLLSLAAQAQPRWKMCVVSDVHLMAPELLRADGRAFQDYLASDRKLLVESAEMLDTLTSRLLRERPDVVLVAGDLTKDGERVSHTMLTSRYLSRLRQAGIRVFVVPGNHDVNNPHAVVFKGDKTVRTSTVSPEEFARLYQDYGYGSALARDAESLSYAAQLAPGVRLLALDACRYDDNDFDSDLCITAGRLKPATVDFIRTQAEAAREAGERLVVMMHHGVVPHFSAEPLILPEYLVDDYTSVASLLSSLGVRVVFTGHLHAQDIASDGSLTDVETGSAVSLPHPYRTVEAFGDSLHISSERVASLGSLEARGIALTDKSKEFARLAVSKMTADYLPSSVPEAMKQRIGALAGEAYVMHIAGDEQPSEAFLREKADVVKTIASLSPELAQMMDGLLTSLSTDTAPADNEAVVAY